MMASTELDLVIKWSGKDYSITELSDSETVGDLKNAIQKQTGVLPERQKLLGIKYKGAIPIFNWITSQILGSKT